MYTVGVSSTHTRREQDSTTAGVFNSLDEGASKTEEFVAKNQKGIFIFIGVIALGALGYLGYTQFVSEPKEDDAANVMFVAQKHFQEATDSQDPKASDSLYAPIPSPVGPSILLRGADRAKRRRPRKSESRTGTPETLE